MEKDWVKVLEHWWKPTLSFHSSSSSSKFRSHSVKFQEVKKESRTNLWYWFSTIHWLEFKFKVENYSPWGRRNLSVGGTNIQSPRIRVFTAHWWFLSAIRRVTVISAQCGMQFTSPGVLDYRVFWRILLLASGVLLLVILCQDIFTLILELCGFFKKVLEQMAAQVKASTRN